MTEVLGIALAVLVFWLVAIVTLAAFAAHRLRRANRVAARVPSPAPLRWHWSASRPARLHRRLQVAVWPIDPDRPQDHLPPAAGTDALRADLVSAALATDATLVGLRHAPNRIRRAGWREASTRVVVIEDLAARVSGRPVPPSRAVRFPPLWPPTVPPGFEDLLERVNCLEHGRAEVARLDLPPPPLRPLPPLAA